MERKFKTGDRVKTKPNAWVSRGLTYGIDYVGTVIDYDDDDFILVKFDNFTNGHAGTSYYRGKGIKYDHKNRQHLYVREDTMCLLGGEEHE